MPIVLVAVPMASRPVLLAPSPCARRYVPLRAPPCARRLGNGGGELRAKPLRFASELFPAEAKEPTAVLAVPRWTRTRRRRGEVLGLCHPCAVRPEAGRAEWVGGAAFCASGRRREGVCPRGRGTGEDGVRFIDRVRPPWGYLHRRIENVRQDPTPREASGSVAWAGMRRHQLGPVYSRGPENEAGLFSEARPGTARRQAAPTSRPGHPAVSQPSPSAATWSCGAAGMEGDGGHGVHLTTSGGVDSTTQPLPFPAEAWAPLVTRMDTASPIATSFCGRHCHRTVFSDSMLKCSSLQPMQYI